MGWKFEKEFRTDKPETIGETDKRFDVENYKDWLETKLEESRILVETLQKDSDFLECLEAAGVDNWDGYEIAQDSMKDDYGYDT